MNKQAAIAGRVFSLLEAPHAGDIRKLLSNTELSWVEPGGDWLAGGFWRRLGAREGDLVLVDLTPARMAVIAQVAGDKEVTSEHRAGQRPWARCAAAVVAVLGEGELADAAVAAQLDFDGLLAEPFEAQVLEQQLLLAQRRAGRRQRIEERYGRVRRLCRAMNRKRRTLREQVDLLCSDLVSSNMQFAQTLKGMQRVYDLLYGLTGEFDLRYLVYKGLRAVREEAPGVRAAVYLCSEGGFMAHMAPGEDADAMAEVEQVFAQSLVGQVVASREPVVLGPGELEWEGGEGMSAVALPVVADGVNIGVVVVYRCGGAALGAREQGRLWPMMEPFGRAIAAAQKVGHLAGGC